MPIVGALPNNIINGQPIDAIPVMADLNWIANQVNANAAGLAGVAAFTTPQNGVNANASTGFPIISQVQANAFNWCGVAGGTPNALTLTPAIAITGYSAGQKFIFQALATNTAAATIAVSGLTTLNLQVDGVALIGGEILINKWYEVLVDASGTMAQIIHLTDSISIAQLIAQTYQAYTSSGVPPAYAITPTVKLGAYAAGVRYNVTFASQSAGNDTLAISGLGSPPNLVYATAAGTYANITAAQIPINWNSDVILISPTQALITDIPIAPSAQIQPISASVAGNALTITASALSLSFRSTTLGSGTVTTVSGTPANLVVPSTATLGTVSAVQSRLAVLALNNAGTIELAVVNLAGGNDLTETGVISTTTIAGGSNTANVIYSTTGRTGVAYRVIGYVESTQATAGTWASSPSTVQGEGGQALAAMSSLGYGQTWQNVAGSRVLGTTYYNTTGRPIVVSVTCSNVSTANTFSVGGIVVAQSANAAASSVGSALVVIVPSGSSYVLTTGGSVSFWAELR